MSWDDWSDLLYDEGEPAHGADCKYCGADELHWVETPTGWRLYDENEEPHNCLWVPITADDFPDL
jgi:hypothetical protein